MRTSAPTLAHIALATALLTAATTLTPMGSTLHAQGGMGGMGGGMGGGGMGGGRRGGGMGGGGMGRGGGGGGERSGSAGVKENLKQNDFIAFVLDHKKPLKISGLQEDSLKAYRKEMLFMQEPLFKDIDKLMSGGARGMGGMGGDRGGGEAGSPRGARGGADGGPQDSVRTLISRLNDIQDAYRDRAKTRLDAGQAHLADSLQTVWLAEQRDKQAKKMESAGMGRRG